MLHVSHLTVRLRRVTESLDTAQQFALRQLLVADVGHLHFCALIRRDVTNFVELGLEVLRLDLVQAQFVRRVARKTHRAVALAGRALERILCRDLIEFDF